MNILPNVKLKGERFGNKLGVEYLTFYNNFYFLTLSKITNTKREFKSQMTIEGFIQANEEEFVNDYLESYPENGYKVNDGDLEHFYDWIQNRYDYITDIMVELYEENLLKNI